VEPGAIPRTSSGKISRNACRQRYLSGELTRSEGSAA
jgi:acyl-CoA synthetase (AMP-forming)/AMP-acid ligase II